MRTRASKGSANGAAHDEALLLLRSIYATTRRQLTTVRRATGLGSALIWALKEVVETPGMRVGDLAARMRIHPSTASNLCARLRREGLVAREKTPEDGRAMCIVATAKGAIRLRNAPQPQRGVLNVALAQLSDAQARQLAKALQPLRRELVRLYGDSDGLRPLE